MDGESRDSTVDKARQILESSDFAGYKIIVKKTNIPEARNLCIKNMAGEMLFFLDSDVLIEPTAIEKLVKAAVKCNCHIVSANANSIVIREPREMWRLLEDLKRDMEDSNVVRVASAAMGHTLIHREVFTKVKFDPKLNLGEDADFCINAREKGFNVCLHLGAKALDVNLGVSKLSDIYVYSPLLPQIRSLKKRAKAKTYGLGFRVTPIDVLKYFIQNKRYLFYLSYTLTIPLALLGLSLGNLYLVAPLLFELVFYTSFQAKRRGIVGGTKAVILSLLVGMPLAVMMLTYSLKTITCRDTRTGSENAQCVAS